MKPERRQVNSGKKFRPLHDDSDSGLLEEADTLVERIEDLINILEGND